MKNPPGAIDVFLVAAEASGDRLGGALMRALRERAGAEVRFSGVGGPEMTAAGLDSLYPMGDFSIIGVNAIPALLPRILKRLFQTVRAVLRQRPSVLVVIDSPSYSLWVARFVRLIDRSIPIVDYVSPSVWAWRSGRARSMRRYVDHVLALLPFEPEAHRRLGGPPCSYVGHPLVEEATLLRPNAEEAHRRNTDPPLIAVLPGSRRGEIAKFAGVFGRALELVQRHIGPIDVVVPTVPDLAQSVTEATATWAVRPRIVTGTAERQAVFRNARAALAKSGTITLELGVAGVPMVGAYQVSELEAWIARRLIDVPSILLVNLVIGRAAIPELLQESCTPERLAVALLQLIADTPERRRQVEALGTLDTVMEIGVRTPAARAAEIVLDVSRRGPVAGATASR